MLVLEISFRTSQKKLFGQGRLDPPFLPPLRWSLPHPLEPSHIPLSPSIPARPVPSSRSSPPPWNWLQPSPYPPPLSRLNEAFSPRPSPGGWRSGRRGQGAGLANGFGIGPCGGGKLSRPQPFLHIPHLTEYQQSSSATGLGHGSRSRKAN